MFSRDTEELFEAPKPKDPAVVHVHVHAPRGNAYSRASSQSSMRNERGFAKIDHLRGLKENVTMGRLIPAGTGFEWYRHVRIPADSLSRRSCAAA